MSNPSPNFLPTTLLAALCLSLGLAPMAGAQIIAEINDESLFVSQTGSTAQPALSTQVGGVVGDLTFTTPAGSTLSFNEFTALIPTTPDLAISGVENLNIALAAPVFSLGFQFVDPTDPPNSTFDITLYTGGAGGSVVNSFNFESPKDLLHFGGFVSDTAFDYVEIREIGGDAGNEIFGQFYTGGVGGEFWTAAGSGNWDTPGNWTGGTVPISTDNVFITDEVTKTITGPASATTVNSLTIDNQDLSNSGSVGSTNLNLSLGALTVSNDLSIGSVATDSGTSALNVNNGTLNVGADTHILDDGTLSVASGGTYNPTGAVNLAGGTLSVASLGSIVPNWTSGTLEVTGAGGLSVFLNGALGGNPISIDASKTLNVTNTLQVNSAVIFDVDGGTVNAGDITAFLGTFNANSGTINVTGTFLNQGTVNLAGADVTVNTFDASAVAPNFTGGTLRIDAGSFIPFAGLPDITLDGAVGGPTLELVNGATADFVGDINVAPTNDAGLSVLSGSSLSTTTDLLIGQTLNDSDSTTTISGTGTTVDIGGNFLMGTGTTNGNNARNLLVVEDNADLTISGNTTLGANARVELTGGSITTSSWSRLGFSQFVHTGGTLNVDTGVFQSGSSNYVLGGTDRPVVNLTNGATMGGANVDINNGELHVLSGSDVAVTTFEAFNAGAGGQTLVEVDGAGSSISSTSTVVIGRSNGEATLNITDGGSFSTAGNTTFGSGNGTTGNVTVDGTDSNFTMTASTLFVGNEGAGTLDVTNGGLVSVVNLTIADSDETGAASPSSTVTINGTDGVTPSTLNVTGSSFIGGSTNEDGGVGILNIEAGAQYTSNGGFIGVGDTTTTITVDGEGTVNVTGAGSFWNAIANGSSDIFVGDTGGGTLNVTAGGRVDADALFIGDEAGNETAVMSVDGTDSTVNVAGLVNVGRLRDGSLSITNGGVLNAGSDLGTSQFDIDTGASADGSSVIVDGVDSHLNHKGTGRMSVGDNGGSGGSPATMDVTNGGQVDTGQFYVADAATSTAVVTINGAGSRIDVRGQATLGDQGNGTVDIEAGGVLAVQADVRIGGIQSGVGTVTVTGAGSELTAGTTLSVADEDTGSGFATGTLNILDGGTVTNTGHGRIAKEGQNVGTVTVGNGAADATWNNQASLFVGGSDVGSGGDGTLNVETNGTVNVTGELKLWDDGKVNLNGGTINVGAFDLVDPPEIPQPNFTFNSGTFRYTAGATLNSETLDDLLGPGVPTLSANKNLVVTDQAVLSAPIRLNGGALSVGSVFNNDTSNLDFDAGAFNLTTDNLTVGVGGIFSDVMTVQLNQTVNITNLATIDAGAELTVIGDFGSGGLTNNGDLVVIDTTGSGKTISGAVNNTAAGAVTVVGDITFADDLTGAGGIFGPGNAIIGAGFAPGASPGTVTVENDLTLTDTSTLFIELGGVNPGSEFDRVEVGGLATIDGALDVSLINGFVPSVGNSFGFLFANGGFGGTFDTLNLPDISGQGLQWLLNPGGSTLFLEVEAILTGDLDGDGFVGINDLNIVLGNWNQNVPPGNPLADPSGDGFVGIDDLNTVLGNWNAGTPPAASAVPEPGTVWLLGMAGVWALRRGAGVNQVRG